MHGDISPNMKAAKKAGENFPDDECIQTGKIDNGILRMT